MSMPRVRLQFMSVLLLLITSAIPTFAQSAANQVITPTNESDLVQLSGNTHPLAKTKFDRGVVSDNLRMEHVFVQLRRSSGEEKGLEALTAELQNPRSAYYHKWLTAEELGRKFGPSRDDVNAVIAWLNSHGLQVNLVHKSRMTIDVSGTAGQISDAFHTEIHAYQVKGEKHIANASDPRIPAALAPVVAGVVSLNDFLPKPLAKKPAPAFSFKCTGCPDGFNNTEQYDVAPQDFVTIYNVAPLYKEKKPITGKGQIVVLLEDTDIQPADLATFRSAFGLASYAGTFSQVHPGPGCADPGLTGSEGEAAIDAEWGGVAAPDADVEIASCADTATNFGPFIAAQNLLDSSSPPPIMSLSYLGCEADQGPAGNAFINSLWQQAAVEGVSAFVASGDNGAAGCDDFNLFPTWATGGIAANGLASTPYDFAAGGTDFLDTALGTNSAYWTKSNSPTGKSAKSYIPEMTWNDSCASSVLFTLFGYPDGVSFCNSATGMNFLGIAAASGAPSFVYSKPYWQSTVFGNPADGKRDLPDASLFASNGFYSHALVYCMSDPNQGGTACNYSVPLDVFNNSAGGTSFAAPGFAGIQALINQKAGGPQGDPAPIYYDLAVGEYGGLSAPNTTNLEQCNSDNGKKVGKACIFHDVTTGDIDVPCYGTNSCFMPTGGYGVLSVSDNSLKVAYPTTQGWDFATGLGSPNVTNLVKNWP